MTGIVDYMKKQSGEAAKLLPTMAEVKRRENKEMAIVIGFFDNLEDPQLRAYMDVGMTNFYPAVTLGRVWLIIISMCFMWRIIKCGVIGAHVHTNCHITGNAWCLAFFFIKIWLLILRDKTYLCNNEY